MAGCWKRVLSSTRAKGSSPTSAKAALEQRGLALGDEVAHGRCPGSLSGKEHGGGHVRHNTTLAHG